MGKYKNPQEDLQKFICLVFGKGENIAVSAELMRSSIYKFGGLLGVSAVMLALLLLNFTS